MRILVDAMGGDLAPDEIVKGAVHAQRELGAEIVLVGQRAAIETCLRNEQALPSRVFRRLQSYSVQVYRWEREAMEQAGRLECLHDCVYLLSGGLGYAEDTGLDVRMADGISSADLVF